MELAQLRMFKAVAELGSIARAADALHCVPSNITTRLKSLESELGAPLFFRVGRGLRISPAGEVFLTYASRILALTAEAKRAVGPASKPTGPLRIGAIESSAMGRLPPLLAKFHARYPAVSLQLTTAVWPQLLEDVLHHKLDGAIVAVDVDRPFLARAPFFTEDLVLIASPSLGPLRCAKDLQGRDIFMWPEGCPYRAALENWLHMNTQSLPIVSIASYGTIIGCVSAGSGVSLVPKGVFQQYSPAAGLSGYEFPELRPIENQFVWHKESGHHPALTAFVEMLRQSP